VCETPIWQCDLYPTLLEAAGLPLEPEAHCDGVGLLELLQTEAVPERDTFFWHYPNYSNQGGVPGGAIRVGDWKLIENFEAGQIALYNLAEDISETFDLAGERPELVSELHGRLQSWREEVGALMPTPNPYYDDIVAGRLPRPDGLGNFPPGTEVSG
ncbi:MAG: sulfatase/phosphatase domain-containing protein, partial [Armatimonadota bacterium]